MCRFQAGLIPVCREYVKEAENGGRRQDSRIKPSKTRPVIIYKDTVASYALNAFSWFETRTAFRNERLDPHG
jgi:hypothetical protein